MDHFILMSSVRTIGTQNLNKNKEDLQKVLAIINKMHKHRFITNLDMVMQNEFQGITNNLQGSLEIIFDVEECIIENDLDFKLKYVLYHDTIESVQSKHSAYERLGFGLINARERLDLIKKTDCRFLITTNNEKTSLTLNNLFLIYEDYLDSWKKKDFPFVKAFLNNLNYKEIAYLFNMHLSSGWRREKSLKMKQYCTIKEMILSSADDDPIKTHE